MQTTFVQFCGSYLLHETPFIQLSVDLGWGRSGLNIVHNKGCKTRFDVAMCTANRCAFRIGRIILVAVFRVVVVRVNMCVRMCDSFTKGGGLMHLLWIAIAVRHPPVFQDSWTPPPPCGASVRYGNIVKIPRIFAGHLREGATRAPMFQAGDLSWLSGALG